MNNFEPRAIYHIYSHANGSDLLFRTNDNYLYFLQKYFKYVHPIADTFAYCLMPNHFHFMIRIRSIQCISEFLQIKKPELQVEMNDSLFSDVISKQFSHFLNGYTQAYNKVFKRKGSLFMPNFKRKLVTGDNYFTRLIVYIHANPIAHQFANEFHEWAYSSYNIYLSDKPSNLNKNEGLEWFGNKGEFVKIHLNLKRAFLQPSKGSEPLEGLN